MSLGDVGSDDDVAELELADELVVVSELLGSDSTPCSSEAQPARTRTAEATKAMMNRIAEYLSLNLHHLYQ